MSCSQETFETAFSAREARLGWAGRFGEAPPPEEYKRALSCNDLFIYCGE